MTNADRIRTMSDEELLDRFVDYFDCDACVEMAGSHDYDYCPHNGGCRTFWREWLKQEVDNDSK